MDGSNFDRFTRAFARRVSRRGALALAAGLVALRARDGRATPSAQLGPSTCGSAGDVCTMHLGCCSGHTCVTSTINVNYGVCVSGGVGGTVSSANAGLISPYSETLEQEIAALATDPAVTGAGATTVTDPQADKEARMLARRSKRESRRTTRRTNSKTRRTTRRTERAAEEEANRIAAGPAVEGEIFPLEVGHPEVLRVINRDIDPITITAIEPLRHPGDIQWFPPGSAPILGVNESFSFLSGVPAPPEGDNPGTQTWTDAQICDGKAGAGFKLYVAFSHDAPNREYEFFCNSPFSPAPVPQEDPDEAARDQRRRRKKKQARKQQNAKNKRRKQRKKKRKK